VQVKEVSADSDRLEGFSSVRTLTIDDGTKKTVWNIANGVLSPLEGFMSAEQYGSVLDQMRLGDDLPWTLPVLMMASDGTTIEEEEEVLLVDAERKPVAVLESSGTFEIDKRKHAHRVFGTEDPAHPGVAKAYGGSRTAVGGILRAVVKPSYGVYADVTLTPRETRVLFSEKGWKAVVAFQTRNAPHINHEYLQKSALALVDGLFVNPVLGRKKPGDFKDEVILSSYRALIESYYPRNSVVLSALHYEMQYAGPKEAVMHAIMRKNFGCTHITIGRDHAGVGSFYPPYAAQ
jgi:sulfate adenylyltransferase